MTQPTTQLTLLSLEELTRLEDVVREGLKAFEEVGNALAKIRDNLKAVANDPIVLQKVQAKLEKKKTDIAHASAEVVAEAVATVTGRARPEPKAARTESSAVLKLALAKADGNGHKVEAAAFAPPEALGELLRHLKNIRRHLEYVSKDSTEEVTKAVASAIKITEDLQGKAPIESAVKVKTCKVCTKAVPAGAVICPNCGEPVR